MARTQARDKDKTIAALKARIEALEHEVEELRNPVVRLEVGRDRRIIDANETLGRLMGRPASRLRGRRMDRVLSDYQDKPNTVFDHFVKGTPYPGPAKPFLTMEIGDTGRFFQFAVRPKRDRRGTVRSLTFTGRDVTIDLQQERRKHYRRTGEALHRVIDRMGLGIVHAYNSKGARFTASTRMGGVSNSIAVSLGFKVEGARATYKYYQPKAELWQAPVTRLFPEATIRKLNAALRANTYSHVDGEILERDGSTRPARLSILPYTGLWSNTVFAVLIEDRSEGEQVLQTLSQQIIDSEERYRNLFESANHAISLENLDGGILDCNERACTLYGYTHDEMLRLNMAKLLPPGSAKTISSFRREILRHGWAIIETKCLTKDGSIFDVEIAASLVDIGGRRLLHVVCRDITMRRRAEAALQASEQRYRAIVQDQTDLICRFRPDGTLTFVNDAYARYFDKKPEELVGGAFFPLIPKEDKERVRENIAVLSREHPMSTHEHRVIAPQGEIRWQQWTNRAIHDDRGRLVEFQSVGRDVTERRRAEEALRESEEKYRTLVEQSLQGTVVAQGAPPRLVFVNPALADILGYTIDELLALPGRKIRALIDPADRGMFFERYRDRISGKATPQRYEVRVLRKDGSVRWLEMSANRITYDGRPAVQATFVDITERKQIERRIHDSEARYRDLVENMTEVIYTLDTAGRVASVNEAVRNILGYEPDEMLGHNFSRWVPRAYLADAKAAFRSILAGNKVTVETVLVDKSGRPHDVEFSSSSIVTEERVAGARGIVRDVTERKRLEREIRESEQKYRALVEASPDAVFQHDRDGRYLYINAAGAGFYGLEPEAIIGKRIDELHPKAVADELLDEVGRVFRDERPIERDSTFTTDQGRFHFLIVLAPIRDERDNVASIIGIARNVTEQRLLQEQLQRAARLASVGTLAAGVAHEINNPLAVISVDLPRLKRQYKDDPFVTKLCSKLLRMTKRISEITGGLLTFSKATAGAFDKHNLHGPLNGALDLMRSRFDYEHKRLVRRYASRLPAVWCDSDQLQQVFVNLCINALEAMHEQGKLTVSAKVDRRDRTVTLTFADTGKGIAADAIERAFDPFYTTKDTGTGLGLAISHSIIEEHGGRIAIDGKRGKGTRVSVVLPVHRTQPAESEHRAGRATKAGRGRPR